MAKILVALRSNIIWDKKNPLAIDAFYEGLLKKLVEHGNDVLFLRINDFRCVNKHISMVHKFSPNLIITPNNDIPEKLLKATSCPIALINADSPDYYLNKQYIKENLDRYYFFHHDQVMFYTDAICKIFGAKRSQNYFFGNATIIQAERLPIKNNIVFMGTLGWTDAVKTLFVECDDDQDLREFWDEFEKGTTLPENYKFYYLQALTSNNRIKTLDAISDLGLKLYGFKQQFKELIPYSINLLKCYDITPMYSVEDIQNEFNQSLIAPTLYNAQARGGYSWRVVDVMASSACLISPPSISLQQEFQFIPIYNSPSEARELCIKLINDNSFRSDIVCKSNTIIEEKYRFENCFKRLEEATGIKILNNSTTGKLNAMYNVKKEVISRIPLKLELSLMSIPLFFHFLPFFNRNRVVKKINLIREKLLRKRKR